MGEFDDVLAMEPGDEWNDHDAGLDARPLVEHAPLAARLRLPNARVELRGDVPLDVVDALADLTDKRLELWDDAPRVVLTVDEVDGRLEVIDLEIGAVASAADRAELLDSLVDVLGRTAERTDPTRLHLVVASVEMDCGDERCGVILVAPECGIRHRLVAEMLAAGAAYLSADRAVLLPGSRTTFASPTPVGRPGPDGGHGGGGWSPGSSLSRVVPCTTSRLVVLVGAAPGADTDLVELSPTEGIVELLRQGAGLERYGPAALDVVATLASEAAFWRLDLDPDDEASLDRALRGLAGLRPPRERRFVVVHQIEVPTGLPLRVMRTDDGGVLADGASGRVIAISRGELDAIERHYLTGGGTSDEDWSRLRAAGVELPQRRGATNRSMPPNAFGLPNAPTGAAATERWSGSRSGQHDVAGGPGAVGEAVRRGVLELDDTIGREVLERHAAAREEVRRVESVLHDVVERMESIDIEPLVLGAPVLAHDGVLPAEFTDVERIDLLLDVEDAPHAVRVLTDAGFVESPVATRVGVDHTGDPVVLTSPDGVPVRLHVRLSVGPFGELVDHAEIHGRSVPLSLGNLWCRALHPEDRFVLAGVQLDVRQGGHGVQELRELILSAPRVESLMAGALDASDRWGATRSLLAAMRAADDALPGLPAWLMTRARHADAAPRRRRGWRGRRAERRASR